MAKTWESYRQMEGVETDGTKRLPICFCLDTSGSMKAIISPNDRGEIVGRVKLDGRLRIVRDGGVTAITELKKSMKEFLKKIRQNSIAAGAAEIAVVAFDDCAKSIVDFCRVEDVPEEQIDEIVVGDNTYMGEGLQMALDKLESCMELYRTHDIDFYPPWLIVMTDGYPNGNSYELNDAEERIKNLVEQEDLYVLPIGIGSKVDFKFLTDLALGRTPVKIRAVDFPALFDRLEEAACGISQTIEGSYKDIDVNVQIGEKIKQSENEVHDNRELRDTIELAFQVPNFIYFDEEEELS